MMVDEATLTSNKAIAKEEVYKSLRDLLSVKITLPLGNPNYKLIHTNSFIWCDLSELIDLRNFDVIAKTMQSTFNRHTTYRKNRWYVEAVTINEDNNKGTMDLELNPFPSTLKDYQKEFTSFTEAYQNAQNQNKTNTATTSTGNSTLKGGQGEVIDNLVKKICGNITDELEKCKAIHRWLQDNVIYSWYECSRYDKDPVKCYNNRNHLNCADCSTLTCAMMLSAGLNAYVVNRQYNGGHFWTLIEINGKTYASDQTGRESAGMKGSEFNTVWSHSGRANTSITSYSRKCGSKPCC